MSDVHQQGAIEMPVERHETAVPGLRAPRLRLEAAPRPAARTKARCIYIYVSIWECRRLCPIIDDSKFE